MARSWAERDDDLVLRHPGAYADHAADFWFMVGADVDRGLQSALRTMVMRCTNRSNALAGRAHMEESDGRAAQPPGPGG